MPVGGEMRRLVPIRSEGRSAPVRAGPPPVPRRGKRGEKGARRVLPCWGSLPPVARRPPAARKETPRSKQASGPVPGPACLRAGPSKIICTLARFGIPLGNERTGLPSPMAKRSPPPPFLPLDYSADARDPVPDAYLHQTLGLSRLEGRKRSFV